MFSDVIMPQIQKIIELTKEYKIKWRPFQEYYDFNMNNGIDQILPCDLQNEFTDLLLEESFFAEKNGEYLFLFSSNWISGKDGSKSLHRELMISCSIYSEIINVPRYGEQVFEDLYKSIKEYWEHKCGMYSQEASDIYDVLSTFSTD